ncbi:MAG: 2-dehydro-3-deoxygalactonokinase [Pseudomonadota bacterium]|nr:2-dehydro-3-deoxygalactonokinase [Pseudomonadota bacterium]
MDILIDWGSTNFRAFFMENGRPVQRLNLAGQGIFKSFAPSASSRIGDYSAFLERELAAWLTSKPKASVLMCGMVGSREGWVPTPFAPLPVSFDDLAARLYHLTPEQRGSLPDCDIAIVPGISTCQTDGRFDVIRSEEVKALGALANLGLSDALLCIPGTHCKWVYVESGAVRAFHTLPSGELYGLLHESGSLSLLLREESARGDAPDDMHSFDLGMALAKEGQDLLADIWQVRSQKLLSTAPPASLRSYLSGILMGHELKQAQAYFPGLSQVVLIADAGARQMFYKRALNQSGLDVLASIDNETAVCEGLARIGRLVAH